MDADAFLMKVQSANFSELAKTKGIRRTTAPRRAQALTQAMKGVYVYPDAHSERFVRVDSYGLEWDSYLAVRDMAYDHFEQRGLHAHLMAR